MKQSSRRFIDGGYVDNSNSAMTLARMQAECEAASDVLDCSDGFKIIISGDGIQGTLFYNPDFPPGSFLGPEQNGFNGPTPSFLARQAPEAADLIPYAVAESSLYQNGSRAISYYWHG